MQNTLTQKIEAILFYTAEAVEEKKLLKILDISEEELAKALTELSQHLQERGTRLVHGAGTVLLATAPEHSTLIEKMIKEERESPLGRASLETLSIIAYKGPVSKKEVEYIRGVNSDYAIRSLLLRGLIDKAQNETDMRGSVYTVSTETLLHLGIPSIADLPEYASVKKQLDIQEDSVEQSIENTMPETEHEGGN